MNSIYSLFCFTSDSDDLLNTFLCLICTWFQYLYINSNDIVNFIYTLIKNLSFKLGKIPSTYSDTNLFLNIPNLKNCPQNLTKYETKQNLKIPIF